MSLSETVEGKQTKEFESKIEQPASKSIGNSVEATQLEQGQNSRTVDDRNSLKFEHSLGQNNEERQASCLSGSNENRNSKKIQLDSQDEGLNIASLKKHGSTQEENRESTSK